MFIELTISCIYASREMECLNRGKSFTVLIIGCLLSSVLFSSVGFVDVARSEGTGPRSDLIINFYNGSSQAYTALKSGDVDLLYWPLNSTCLQDAKNDPNLIVAEDNDNRMFQLDINNNYTIPDYPGVKSPTYEVTFRQAIAHAIDKDHILNAYWFNLASRIDQPVPRMFEFWMNETYSDDGYPYKYNLTRAAELLDELGFIDTDENGWRNYPSGWPGASNADFTEYPLKVYGRVDHEARLETGRYLVAQLENLGVKCNKTEFTLQEMYPVVIYDRNYHVYTGGWSLSKYPYFLYGLYHSNNWCIGGSDYASGMNFSNQPNYPDLDSLLEQLDYAASFEDARVACKKALGLFVEKCITIPLASPKMFSAYRKEVHNVVTTPILGLRNNYALLSAYKDDGTPICVGSHAAPSGLNILYSPWVQDYYVLDNIYEELTIVQHKNPTEDQPWLANSWDIGTWFDTDAGTNKSKFTFYLRNDSYWTKPVTGDIISQFTAEDYEFSVWYTYQTPDSWSHSNFWYVHHVKVVDDFTIEVYMNTSSIWDFGRLVSSPILPMQVWTNFTQLAESTTQTFIEGTNATTPGYLSLVGAPVAINSVEADGIELTEYIDYSMESGKVKILTDLSAGTNITIVYWARGDSHGFYPGDLPWQDILVGNGPFYLTDITPLVGGNAYLKANPNYFMSPTAFSRDVAILNVTPSKTVATSGETISIEVLAENQGNITETFYVELYANSTLLGTKTASSMMPNTSKTLEFQWNTTSFEIANYILKAVAETLADETDTSDNTYIDGTVTITMPSTTYVHPSPSETRITLGVTFPVDVMVTNVTNLYGFEIKLYYNTTILNALNASEGSFLKQAGNTMIFANVVNDDEGYIWFAVTLLGAENSVNGDGHLFKTFFNASMSAAGTSSLTFETVKLSDPQSQAIDRYVINGLVEVVEVDAKNFQAVKNETNYEVATVSNATIQDFQYNETESQISLVATGPSGYSSFCQMTIPKDLLDGTLVILVNGKPIYYDKVENETHRTLIFSFSCSTVEIEIVLTLKGDVNGDRVVNLYDAVLVLVAYGSKPGDPNWNPIVDLIRDDKIDIYDAVVVCSQYGKTWTP